MPTSGDGEADDALAGQSEPVRRWLTGFFRRRMGCDADIEDMVQDVFARIVARAGDTPIQNLNAYVTRTASSVLADTGRRRLSHRSGDHVSFDPEHHGGEEIDPERVLSGREELNAATEALLSLPERTRTVFVLRRLEGYRYSEIARHLGISVSAVEKHMVKAIGHLGETLETRRGS